MKEPDQDKPEHRKPGPHERLFSLAPLSFIDAVRKVVKAKPPARKPKKKK